ncbi:DNA invertase Pin-like site-specific DNA recombinase [Saccharopolyspora phatthalungensis]|uniref:DNA invertase Pin-like site-specific DNA recombinase n=2 Tax=Saccharopolyspora phatthalungensis TaxID=664693 RepID=A0A840Q5L7_9PSEU|nr:DNA invertase Pin-like site-specific DNA recombinase [Saccharopolyspora phatthalungensis]
MRCFDDASGGTLARPGPQRVLDAARAGLLDVLLVDNVHSLSRKVRHLHFLLGKLDSYGVAFHPALDRSFDTSTPEGRFQVQMLGSFAQFEKAGVFEDRRAARGSSTRSSNGCSPVQGLGRSATVRPISHSAATNQ